MLQLSEADNGREIELRLHEILEIQLIERPSTGFRWEVKANGKPSLEPISDTSDSTKGIGQPVKRQFKFQAIQQGNADISLVYHRSWEKNVVPTRQYALTVRVSQ